MTARRSAASTTIPASAGQSIGGAGGPVIIRVVDPVAAAGVAIGLFALAVAVFNLWRAELRGPALRAWSAAGSTFVRMSASPGDESRLLVNVYRDIVVTNDSGRPGLLGDVSCEPLGTLPMDVHTVTVGVVDDDVPVPRPLVSLNKVVERGSPLRLTVAWWLALPPESEEMVREQIRAPQSALAMKVAIYEYQEGRTLRHDVVLRPKSGAVELIKWSEGPAWGI